MNIGEAAAASGLSAKAIRRYEEAGLIRPRRLANGYRSYNERDVAALRFARHARELAFPLVEVKRLLALWSDDSRASADVRSIAQEHILALEAKAASLQAIAGSLRQLVSCCRGDSRPDCPILEELAK